MNTNTGISQSITATGIGSQLRHLDSVLQSARESYVQVLGIGKHTTIFDFDANQLGELLSLLLDQHPELKI
mgnify:CR=1 FL=1